MEKNRRMQACVIPAYQSKAGARGFGAFLVAMASVFPWTAFAHEFWLEPEYYRLTPDQSITASLRNGENFEGASFPYAPQRFSRFIIEAPSSVEAVSSRLGDDPAVNQSASAGLNLITYVSTGSTVTHDTFDSFKQFLSEEGLMWASSLHADRQLPMASITEVFIRYAKSLVAVGEPTGSDRPTGMELELVALDNPYQSSAGSDGERKVLPVQVLYQGKPLPEVQVSVFYRDEDEVVSVNRLQADAAGQVVIDIAPAGVFMVNAVHLRTPSARMMLATGAVWESLWASLTFSTAPN